MSKSWARFLEMTNVLEPQVDGINISENLLAYTSDDLKKFPEEYRICLKNHGLMKLYVERM